MGESMSSAQSAGEGRGTWFGRMRRKLEALVHSEHAGKGVFLASLAETTFVPIPIEVVLIPAMLGNRRRAFRLAVMALAGCLLGATAGYFIGMFAWETVGEWAVEQTGTTERFEKVRTKIDEQGFWYLLFVAVSPVPFQLGYLGAGVVSYSFFGFFGAAALGRGSRYFGLWLLVALMGKAAGPWLDKHGAEIGIGITVVFIGVYAVVTFVL